MPQLALDDVERDPLVREFDAWAWRSWCGAKRRRTPGEQLPAPPSSDFTVGASVRFKNGSTVVTVVVPVPGAVTAQQAPGTGSQVGPAARKKALVKSARKVATKVGPVRLTIKPTKAGEKVLRRNRKLSIRMRITVKPTGGTAGSTFKRVTIKRKKR